MANHNCRSKWDPGTKAELLTTSLGQATTQHGKGWARDLADEAVYISLKTLKFKVEEARGVMSGFVVPFRLGAIPDNNYRSHADSITAGLLDHATDSDHVNATNPIGQFGWITKVDPDTPYTILNNLMKAVRDCLDNPPGGGKGLTKAAPQAKAASKGKTGKGGRG